MCAKVSRSRVPCSCTLDVPYLKLDGIAGRHHRAFAGGRLLTGCGWYPRYPRVHVYSQGGPSARSLGGIPYCARHPSLINPRRTNHDHFENIVVHRHNFILEVQMVVPSCHQLAQRHGGSVRFSTQGRAFGPARPWWQDNRFSRDFQIGESFNVSTSQHVVHVRGVVFIHLVIAGVRG